MNSNDTIIAQVTPPGRGGVGILRISGIEARNVAKAVLGKIPVPRYANYTIFKDINGITIDQGIALWFPGPNSFTGEDVLELQGHGGTVILDLLLKRILNLPGIRIARPGEFSERAFLNNKLDLTQAEAIIDLINASSEQAARSAINSLQGAFSLRIKQLKKTLIHIRMHVEASIDFADENINLISKSQIKAQLDKIIKDLNSVRTEAHQGSLLCEGVRVVIAGYPNAGKSSLMNALAGHEAAIVTNIPGTTRDIIREHIHIEGVPFNIIDTAGLQHTSDEVELIGIERAYQEIKYADHLLFVVDATTTDAINIKKICPDFFAHIPTKIPITLIRNKADITGETLGINNLNGYTFISLSALTGEGLDSLRTYLQQSIGFSSNSIEGRFLARRRHLQALETAVKHIERGKNQIASMPASSELLAEELRLAQQNISEITGEFTSDDLLKTIFSNFCIGK